MVKILKIISFCILITVSKAQNDLDLVWSNEQILSPSETMDQKFPDAVIDENGVMHIVWLEQHGDQKSIQYSSSADGGSSFSQPAQVNQLDRHIIAYMQSGPKIRIRDNELFVIFMMHDENEYPSVYMSYSSDGGQTWSEETEVSDQPYRNAYPDLEIDISGNLHLIYYNYSQSWSFVGVFYAVTSQDPSGFQVSIPLGITDETQEPCDCCQPDLAVSNGGDIYVAYRNNITNHRDHYLVKKTQEDSTFSNPIQISAYEDYINFCPASGPSLSLNDSLVSVSYFVHENNSSFVNYSSLNEIVFSNETIVHNNGYQQNYSHSVLHGNFIHIAWIEHGLGNPDIFYGVMEIGNNELVNIRRVNQDSTSGEVTQKDPTLLWANNSLFCFWSDGRSGLYQVYLSKATLDTQTVNIGHTNSGIFPDSISLYPVYPNPFNPVTTLRYDLPEDALVNITIYDMMGRIVKTLINDQQTAGYRSTQWNATNDAGSPVSAGIYLYMIQAGEFRQTRKMVLLK